MRRLATCTICEATCGIVVDVEGSGAGARVTGVRGDPDDPVSQGYVCPKVVAMQDLHEDPDRLRAPLVRDPGSGDFRRATWDEALARAGDGLRDVVRRAGRDAVAIYQGNPTAHNLGLLTVGQLAFRAFGTKNLYSASSADQVPHMRAAHDMFGHVIFMPVPDIDRTDHWLVVGANPVVSNGSLMTAPDVKRRIKDLHARGGKLVVVDPRRTETAELADRHLFLRPGSDALFFFALLHVVFAEKLGAPGRLAPHLGGLAELEQVAARFSPERVASATGISADDLRTTARDFARAPRAACYVRVGTCHQEHGTLASWLAWALAAVTGNLDREGGLMWTTPAADIAAIASLAGLGGHGRFKSRVRGLAETGGELPIATLADEIEVPGRDRVRALVTSAGNPVLSAPNGARLDRALGTLDFMVAIDCYLNETTRHAHVILPPCSPLQRAHYDLALNAFGVENSAKWVDPPLARGADEKDDAEIIRELFVRFALGPRDRTAAGRVLQAIVDGVLDPTRIVDLALRIGPYGALRQRLGRGSARGSARDSASARAASARAASARATTAPLTLEALRRSPHGIRLGALEPRLPGLLRTKSRKVELAPPAFLAEVPALEATLDRPVPDLVLVGRRQLRSNNSWLHNSERLVKGPARCTLLLHPDDARQRSLTNGSRARVTSARGSVEATVAVSDEMMPGVASLPHGWGHHRDGIQVAVARAHAGVSINDLTDEERVDRLTGNAAFSATPIEVAPAERQPSAAAAFEG